MSILETKEKIESRIEAACQKAGRKRNEIHLVAVSKSFPIEKIKEAYSAGFRNFGENKAQEFRDKVPVLPDDIQWHFIGHPQSKQVKYFSAFVHLIHGVDSLKLLQVINKEGTKHNRVINCLLQFHIAQEETKFGFNIEEVDIPICPYVGPEVVMGSTRMKSGTAQKLVLNMLTTTAMVRLGKTYENMMIDLQMTNKKLVERAKRIVMTITGVDYDEATKYLEQSNYHVKSALVMILAEVSFDEAKVRLEKAEGFVRRAIQPD